MNSHFLQKVSIMLMISLGIFFVAFATSFYSALASDLMIYFSGILFCIGCLLYSGLAIRSYKEETDGKYGASKNAARWAIRMCASVFGLAGIGTFFALTASTVDFFGYYFLPIVSEPTIFLIKCLLGYCGLSFVCFIFWSFIGDRECNRAKAW